MNTIKKIIIAVLLLNIVILILLFFLGRVYIVKGIYLAYPICGILFSIAFLIILSIIKKMSSNNKFWMLFFIICILFASLLFSFIIFEIRKQLINNEKYYKISVEELSYENSLFVYEYNAMMENRGCLCIKINDYIYKKIPNTIYRIDSGYSLSKPDSFILMYNSETKLLNMKYKTNEDSDYIEKIITIDNWTYI